MTNKPWRLADHVVGKNLFLSTDHIQVMDNLLSAISSHYPCCLLCCENPALLDYYAKIFLRRMSQGPGGSVSTEVETIEASAEDGFLDKLNTLLEDISLEQALSLTDAPLPRRCVIISRVENLSAENEEALRYLIRDFPATNLAYLFTASGRDVQSGSLMPLFRPSLKELHIEVPDVLALTEIHVAVQKSSKAAAIDKLLTRLFSEPMKSG
jgi:hypothetical protein